MAPLKKFPPIHHKDPGLAIRLHEETLGIFGQGRDIQDWPLLKAYRGGFVEQILETPKEAHQVPDNNEIHKKRQPKTKASYTVTQKNASWGLAAISKSENQEYKYDSTAGEGVFVYVLDSGIDLKHSEFQGRAIKGIDVTEKAFNGSSTSRRQKKHGTGVASIIGGATYGVAKNVTLVDVQVARQSLTNTTKTHLDTEGMMEGLTWTLKNITESHRQNKSVINMSLSVPVGKHCDLIDGVLDNIIKAGIHVVVAAGNNNSNVSSFCPANHEHVISVAGMDHGYNRYNISNWGDSVELFAPTVDIDTAVPGHPLATGTYNGTSFSAPYVSGMVAYLIGLEGPRTPIDMWKRLERLSQKNKVAEPERTPNRFLYNGIKERDRYH